MTRCSSTLPVLICAHVVSGPCPPSQPCEGSGFRACLVCAGGDCDLVTPQSTVKGKGYWGEVEGLEVQLHLNASGDDFVNNPLNFRRVQVRAFSADAEQCPCNFLTGVAGAPSSSMIQHM